MIFFTSDQHFFHKNIIKHSNRPFDNINDMNDSIIKTFNRKVGTHDTTYHIGDFAFAKGEQIKSLLSRLNGNHFLIKGNHDNFSNIDCSKVIGIDNYYELKLNKRMFVLSHYPMCSWNKSYYGSIMIHGHCHGNMNSQNSSINRIDVGIDSAIQLINSYSPFSIDEIIAMKECNKNEKNII